MGMAAEPISTDFEWIQSLIEECRQCPDCGSPVESVVDSRAETILYPPVNLPAGVEWKRGRHSTRQPAKPLREGEFCYYHRRRREDLAREFAREKERDFAGGVISTPPRGRRREKRNLRQLKRLFS